MGTEEIKPKYLPPSPQTVQDCCASLRQLNFSGIPLDPGTPTSPPALVWDEVGKFLSFVGSGSGSGGLTGSPIDWTTNLVINNASVNGFNAGISGNILTTDLSRMAVGTVGQVEVNNPQPAYSQTQARNTAWLLLHTHFALQKLIQDLTARGVLS